LPGPRSRRRRRGARRPPQPLCRRLRARPRRRGAGSRQPNTGDRPTRTRPTHQPWRTSMSPVLIRPRPRPAGVVLRRDALILLVAGAIGITTLAGVDATLRGPRFIDRVTVVNTTPYLVDIEVTGNTGDGWLHLGPVSTGNSHDFRSVVD